MRSSVIRRRRRAFRFNPLALNPVAFYDPSDTSTLFKEVGNTSTANYTISKAAASGGDPVGLVLDKSQGLIRGDNLLVGASAIFTKATGVANGAGFDLTATGTFATLSYSGIVEEGAVYVVKGRFSGNDEQRRIALNVGGTYYQLTVGGGSALTSGEFEVIVAGGSVNTDIQFYAADSVSGETFYFELESVQKIAGNHLTAPSDAARPTYQTSGGLHWLEFDGVDDELSVASRFGLSANPSLLVTAGVRPSAYVENIQRIWHLGQGTAGRTISGALGTSGLSWRHNDGFMQYGFLPVNNDYVISHSRQSGDTYGDQRVFLNSLLQTEVASLNFGGTPFNTDAQFYVGSQGGASNSLGMRMYSMVILGTHTDSQRQQIERWTAGKSGVTL